MAPVLSIPQELDVALWDKEYLDGVIPSSRRTSPAKVLTHFHELIKPRGSGIALDAGCGNGRNSVYLAEMGWKVSGVDASNVAIGLAKQNARQSGLSNEFTFANEILQDSWQFDDESFDLVLDSYVLCHYSCGEFISRYVSEMRRVLKPGGIVFSAFFSDQDSYYREVGQCICPETRYVRDPNNGLCKRLYRPEELKSMFSSFFDVSAEVDYRFIDICLGRKFERSIIGLMLQPR